MRSALALLAVLVVCTLPAATRAADLEGIEDDVEDGRPITRAAAEQPEPPSQVFLGAENAKSIAALSLIHPSARSFQPHPQALMSQ